MWVRLLGTGASDGWPDPWCSCASCRAAAGGGIVRGRSSALVDDRLLLDLGPDTAAAALRQGVSLSTVEAVLVTHAGQQDGPRLRGRRTVVAPAGVPAPLDETVTALEARPGDLVTVAGFAVRVLPAAGDAVAYDVTGADGTRLFWGPGTGPLPAEALALTDNRGYAAVLLDLATWPEQVAELRRRGAVTPATRLLAVHLGHQNPPPAELERTLAGWGVTAPRDGVVLDLGDPPPPLPVGRRVLVLGGARSGKSAYAEQLVAAQPVVTYVATAPPRPGDAEWAARVAAHRLRRPIAWATEETGDVTAHLGSGTVLVDDLGLWLTRVLDEAYAWDGGAPDAVAKRCDDLVEAWRECTGLAVLVAPEVGSGIVPATLSGRLFRDALGALTARLAAASDEVVQVVAGLPRRLR
jgi:adenosylcobinamide kinase/adenosylcobinamide-phosphate guanylyltransferase